MKEFDELLEVWKEQKNNRLSSEQVLNNINLKRNKMAVKLLFGVIAMLFSVAVMLFIWISLDFKKASTHFGLSLLVSLVFLYSIMMFVNLLKLRNTNSMLTPKEHILQLKKIQAQQARMSKYYMNIYFAVLLIGLLLYYNEVLAEASILFKVIAYSLTIGWLLYAQFAMNKKSTIKNQKKLEEMISTLEKIENQL
jgi:hypothetical protein